jgi:hypothetical protein
MVSRDRPASVAVLTARVEAALDVPSLVAPPGETAVSSDEETAAVFGPLLCPARPSSQ